MSAPLYMTGPELRALRLRAGLTLARMGMALDVDDYDYQTTVQRVKRLEARGIRLGVLDEGLRARVDALRASIGDVVL